MSDKDWEEKAEKLLNTVNSPYSDNSRDQDISMVAASLKEAYLKGYDEGVVE